MNIEKNTTYTMKEHKNQIEGARAEIQLLMEEQNQIYQRLIDEVCPDSDMEEWLWDYCFNCDMYSLNKDYQHAVEERIYGSD